MIKLENISLSYGKKGAKVTALKKLNVVINDGEFVTISGKSGCGKTTLLNVLGGITKPDTGDYYHGKNNICKYGDSELAKFRNQCVSFVVQHFALINDKTVFENVRLPLKYRKEKNNNAEKMIDETMDKLGIFQTKHKYPYEISGGEKQRAAICRAIISDTKVILADEPTGALDEETGHMILDILKELNKQGKTIIMVTHDVELAQAGSHRIVMKDGNIIDDIIN